MIKELTLINWKSFSNSTLYIDPLTFIIGTNASGKSNILDALSFLCDLANGKRISEAVERVPMRGVQESDGTIRMLEYSVFLYSLFTEEQTWVVDEIDRCLHPFLTRFVATEALSHPGCKSQIIMTTHDVTILTQDIWRTDEVWFTEKRPDGTTDLYSLYQFRPRFDVDLEKRYREGRWGAVPVIERMRYGREAQEKRA